MSIVDNLAIPDGDVTELIQEIEGFLEGTGFRLSRWATRKTQTKIVYAVHDGDRPGQSRSLKHRQVVAQAVLICPEGYTKDCAAYRELTKIREVVQENMHDGVK